MKFEFEIITFIYGFGGKCGFWGFQKGGLVGAFCNFGVSDTGSPVHF